MTDNAATATSTKSDTSAPAADGGGTSPDSSAKDPSTSKKETAPARPISYFSSVRTDAYRAGWDDIFGPKKKKPRKAR